VTDAALVQTLFVISETIIKDGGRGAHCPPGSHGRLRGEPRVLDDLSPVLPQGPAARPGTYAVFIRFSTTPGDILDDIVSTPRGKLHGVAGFLGGGAERRSYQCRSRLALSERT